jgi:hypothetical protein
MKKIFLSLLLVTLSCMAFAKNEIKPVLKEKVILKDFNNSSTKQIANKLSKSYTNEKAIKTLQNKKAFFCDITASVWAHTEEMLCPDGSTTNFVVMGIVWEYTCTGYYPLYMTWCTDVTVANGC